MGAAAQQFSPRIQAPLSYPSLSLWLCHLDCKMAAGLPDIMSKFQAGRRGKGQQKAFQEVPLAEFRDWDIWLH